MAKNLPLILADVTTATATETEAVSYFSQGRSGSVETMENGNTLVRGLSVFRTGSFKDSRGRRHTYVAQDLDDMASNFSRLRENGSFPNVPVRKDHSISVENVVGYFAAMYRQDQALLVDIEFTEPSAFEKWQRGTYRGRSLEVGGYETNDGEVFAPVATGLAFVDIPAVERLHSKQRPSDLSELDGNEGEIVPEPTITPASFRINGITTSDTDAIQKYISELENRKPEPPATFRIAGAETTDVAAVQTHLDALELFQSQVGEASRSDFVNKLATEGKIGAPQIEGLSKFAKSLDAEQFATFVESYKDAPVSSLFAKHGQNGGGAGGQRPPADPANDSTARIETLQETVKMFRNGGLTEDKVKLMPAYLELQQLTATAR